jgi:FAD/FMN-containing dehydrogenase
VLTRRQFLTTASVAAVTGGCVTAARPSSGDVLLNDVHSRLNPTRVARVVRPAGTDDLVTIVRQARRDGVAVSVMGGRHAMGGQQFGAGTVSLDTSAMTRVLDFDATRGLVTVEAGIQWPALIDALLRAQAGHPQLWGIVQKQTGADRLSMGGAIGRSRRS